MDLNFKGATEFSEKVLVCLVSETMALPSFLVKMDAHNIVARALEVDEGFKGNSGKVLTIVAPYGFSQQYIIVLGLGNAASIDINALNAAGGCLAAKLNEMKVKAADIVLETADSIDHSLLVHLTSGIMLRSYVFDRHFVAKKSDHTLSLAQINILSDDYKAIESQFAKYGAIVDGTLFARDLVTESPNYLFPISFAAECEKLESEGLKVRVLDLSEIKKLKMGALLGVAQGSAHEPRVVVMEWRGSEQSAEMPLALVGKGVTFDSGGINLKGSAGISDMKYDMGGAAAVVGAMLALAKRKASVNVVGIIGLVENMPSGTAQRPSDVVVSMSGQTIEVDNTDAEGRLVLADIMWYVQEEYKPQCIIDLATLTGAITVALGDHYCGLFANDDALATQLMEAGAKVEENAWRLPLHKCYDEQINSEIADVKNVGQSGRGGGSITAAQFLQRFVQKETRWAHLDIAAVTWNKLGGKISPKGATGFGVRLLNQYIMDVLESK